MAKVGAVINNASGTMTPEESEERLEEIKRHLEGRVAPGCLAVVPGAQVGQEVERLKDQGIEVLIIGGGDGTVSTAAGLVGDTGIALAILGLGTRNHFVRDLGIPLEPVEAIRLLDRMQMRQIDLGEVNGHTFINNATLGLYPKIVKERKERTEKHGWRKWRAHIAAALTVLRRLPRMRLTVEDEKFRVRRFTPFLFIGNNEYQEIVNSESTRSSLDDGVLWLCMAHLSGIRSLLRIAWQLVVRDIRSIENLEIRLVKTVTVYSGRKRLRIAIDGETFTLTTPLRFSIRRRGLRVVVP